MNRNADLYYVVNSWDQLTEGAQNEIMVTVLIARVRKLPPHLVAEVAKWIKVGEDLPGEKKQHARPS